MYISVREQSEQIEENVLLYVYFIKFFSKFIVILLAGDCG